MIDQETIERYLKGDLNLTEQRSIDAQLKTNPKLREVFALTEDINNVFQNKEEHNFIENLNKIKYNSTPSARSNSSYKYIRFIGLVGLLLIAAATGYYLLWPQFSSTERIHHPAPSKIEIHTPTKVETEEEHSKPKIEFAADKSNTSTESISEDFNWGNEFATIAELELVIAQSTSNYENDWVIGHFPLDQFNEFNQLSTIAFNGRFKTDKKYSDRDIAFYLFNNDKGAYENFVPQTTYYPKVTQAIGGYEINLEETIVLEDGLYYYLIEEIQTEEVIYAGKFESRVSNLF